jgi:hypothetical protein
LALILPVLFKLCRKCTVDDVTPEWLENFSPSTYYPMQGLLSEEDFKFLCRQPGFDLSLYRKLRRDRLHIFQQYLSRLIVDFNRLHATARAILASSPEDCSELVSQLIWLKVRFSVSVLRVQANYVLCLAGFRSLAAGALIVRLEEMSAQLSSIAAAQVA